MPVKVIMPAASAPKICCAAAAVIGGLTPSPRCSSRTGSASASTTATTFVASTGTHIAEASQRRSRRNRA